MKNITHQRAAVIVALLGPLLVGACGSSTPSDSAIGVDVSALETQMTAEPTEVWSKKHKGANDDQSDRPIGSADDTRTPHYPGEIFDIVWHCLDTNGGGWPTVGECIWQRQNP